MTVEQALSQAILYEDSISTQYRNAAQESTQNEVRAFYEALAKDEASHAAYLRQQLADWNQKRQLGGQGPVGSMKPNAKILAAAGRTDAAFSSGSEGGMLAGLENALRAERESSAFYRKHASELPEPANALFNRMIEIEDGHSAIVQAQLDLVSRSGHWFDVREFTMED
ncbi:MAG TPA: hypothetical protein PLC54_02530 [Spirochaetales bacterium]|nr:hypothetical protein [Spirochaetales bacterium]